MPGRLPAEAALAAAAAISIDLHRTWEAKGYAAACPPSDRASSSRSPSGSIPSGGGSSFFDRAMHRVQSFSSLPPVIFHKYQVEKTLENGVFGEVLKAYKVTTHQIQCRCFYKKTISTVMLLLQLCVTFSPLLMPSTNATADQP